MRQKRNSEQSPSERVVRNIQRKTRKQYGVGFGRRQIKIRNRYSRAKYRRCGNMVNGWQTNYR